MLADVIEIFARELEEHGERLILDNYIPADGEYILVNPEDFTIIDRVDIKKDKETRDIDRNNPHTDFICQADYNSKYLNSDKALTSKNIHSNNFLTFFVKKENVHDNTKINDDIIGKYYEVFRNPASKAKYRDKKTKIIIESLEKEINQPNEVVINRIEKWVKNNLYELVDKDSRDKSYLKIFFKYDLDTYKRESDRYILPNIYNSNDYNEIVNDEVYGLPNDNMGLNAKKPYLENKSRKSTVPTLIGLDEILMQKMFFDHLFNLANAGKYNIYVSETGVRGITDDKLPDTDLRGYFLRIRKGKKKKEAEIIDFDNIGLYKVTIKPFSFRNALELEKSELRYRTIEKLAEVKNEINEVFFYKFLTNNYFTEAKDLSLNDPVLKRNILLSRTALFRWFYKGNNEGVWKLLNIISLDLIKGAIYNGYLLKAGEQFNLRCSLKYYFEGGEDMADILVEVKNSLREKINVRDTDYFNSEDEYYFAVGQVTYYLLSLSKANKKPHSLANPVFNAKSDEQIKEILKRLFKKYNYVEKMGRRFSHLYAMVSGYVPKEGKINDDLIIAGYLHSNLIYEKSTEEVADNE